MCEAGNGYVSLSPGVSAVELVGDSRVFVWSAFDARCQAPRHYPPSSQYVAAATRCPSRRGANPVVTGRKIGLQASGGRRFAKKIVDVGVMMPC